MKPHLVSLRSWIDEQYKSYPSTTPKQQKEETAAEFSVGISTIYRWLKSGNVYIEYQPASMLGDDDSITIWKIEKTICE